MEFETWNINNTGITNTFSIPPCFSLSPRNRRDTRVFLFNHKVHKVHKDNKIIIENEIANKVIGLAIEVHRILGPGLLESVYKECLYYKILENDFFVEKEKALPLIFENTKLDCAYRIDLLVEKKLVVELKTVDVLNEIHLAQVLTYLKLGNYKLGLLINFNVSLFKMELKEL